MNPSVRTEWRKAGRFSFWATRQDSTMLITRVAPNLYQVRINGELKGQAHRKSEAMELATGFPLEESK